MFCVYNLTLLVEVVELLCYKCNENILFLYMIVDFFLEKLLPSGWKKPIWCFSIEKNGVNRGVSRSAEPPPPRKGKF